METRAGTQADVLARGFQVIGAQTGAAAITRSCRSRGPRPPLHFAHEAMPRRSVRVGKLENHPSPMRRSAEGLGP